MEARRIIVGEPIKESAAQRPDLTGALRLVAGFCVMFTGASLIDMGLAIGPADLNAADTRFVTLAAVAGSMPLLAIGILGLEAAAFGLSRRTLILAVALASIGLVVNFAGLMMFIGARSATIAAASEQTRPLVVATGVRGLSSFICFGVAFAIGAVFGVRRLLRAENT